MWPRNVSLSIAVTRFVHLHFPNKRNMSGGGLNAVYVRGSSLDWPCLHRSLSDICDIPFQAQVARNLFFFKFCLTKLWTSCDLRRTMLVVLIHATLPTSIASGGMQVVPGFCWERRSCAGVALLYQEPTFKISHHRACPYVPCTSFEDGNTLDKIGVGNYAKLPF